MAKSTVFLIDDHPVLRDGLKQLIDAQPDLVVSGQAANMSDTIRAFDRQTPDLAIVDIFLEGTNGIELTKVIRSRFSNVKVLVLSMHDEEVYARRALRAGALGYVMKQEVSSTILVAIRAALKGQIYVSPSLAALRFETEDTPDDADRAAFGVDTLSDRELEIFELFGHGMSRKEIAGRIGVSIKTVEAHRANIREKMGLRDASDLLRRAIQWIERTR